MRPAAAVILVILAFSLPAAAVRANEQPAPRIVSAPVAELLAMESDPVGSLFAPVGQTTETESGGPRAAASSRRATPSGPPT